MMMLSSKKEVQCQCPECERVYTFNLTDEEYEKFTYYMMGGDIFIQNVFPKRSASERELLRGGMCGECWNEMFGYFDDEGDE